jgi:uncharacterized membrane protein YccC
VTQLPLTGSEAVDAVLEDFPGASAWLARKGVICTECGEVFWGTLRELTQYRRLTEDQFQRLLDELNAYLAQQPATPDP